MGIIKKNTDIAKSLGVDVDKLPPEAREFLVDRANRIMQEEQSDRETFEAELKGFSDAELMVFVPDVYQKNIYRIDYGKLKENGIKLISFDIDDTIGDVLIHHIKAGLPGTKVTMSKDAQELFARLKSMGFIVTLLTNAKAEIAVDTCDSLLADGYIARAKKPDTKNFEAMMERFGITDPKQVAHVGNSIAQDVRGGNQAGVTTCLVRRAGNSMKVGNALMKLVGVKTKGHQIRKRLLERDLWRKHHADAKGDQYYQLGELPKYRVKRTFTQENIAEAAAADLISKINADKDQTITLEDVLRNIDKGH